MFTTLGLLVTVLLVFVLSLRGQLPSRNERMEKAKDVVRTASERRFFKNLPLTQTDRGRVHFLHWFTPHRHNMRAQVKGGITLLPKRTLKQKIFNRRVAMFASTAIVSGALTWYFLGVPMPIPGLGATVTFDAATTLDSLTVQAGDTAVLNSGITLTIDGQDGSNYAWNVSATGTFTDNGGTVIFTSTETGTLIITGGVDAAHDFNNVQVNASGGDYTLSGNGMKCGGTFTLTAGSLNPSTLPFESTGVASITGTFGTGTPSGTYTFTSTFTINAGGTVKGSSATMTFNGNVSVATTATYTKGTGTFTVNADLTVEDVDGTNDLGTVQISTSNTDMTTASSLLMTTLTVDANCSIIIVATHEVLATSSVTNNGTITPQTTGRLIRDDATNWDIWCATLNKNVITNDFVAADLVDIKAGSLTINETGDCARMTITGTLLGSSGVTLTVSGNWINNGVFTHGNGIVVWDENMTVSGTTTTSAFYTLTHETPDKTLTVTNGYTITVSNSITLKGDVSNDLTLTPTAAGTWYLTSTAGTMDVQYVDVEYSNADGGDWIIAYNSEDSLNNSHWQFLTPGEIVWDGESCPGDPLASTAANWVGDVAPGVGDIPVFDDTDINACTWDIDVVFNDFQINTGYTGTITTTSGFTSGGLTLASGATLVIAAGDEVLNTGTYTPGGTLTPQTTGRLINDNGTTWQIYTASVDKNALVNDFATADVVQIKAGILNINEDAASGNCTVDSGCTITLDGTSGTVTYTLDTGSTLNNLGTVQVTNSDNTVKLTSGGTWTYTGADIDFNNLNLTIGKVDYQVDMVVS